MKKADKQGHSHYSVDERTQEIPWCIVRCHAGSRHSLRWSRCCRIHGLRIRNSDCSPRQLAPRRQIRPSSSIPLYVTLNLLENALTSQTRSLSCFLSHYNSSQQLGSWRMVYSSDQARTTLKLNGRKIYSELEQSFSVLYFPGLVRASWTSSSRSSELSLGKLSDPVFRDM